MTGAVRSVAALALGYVLGATPIVGALKRQQPGAREDATLSNYSFGGWPKEFDGAKDHVMVFQFGKVASTTIQSGMGSLMLPPHYLTSNDLERPHPRGFKTHRGIAAREAIEEMEPGGRMWIVTVTRNRFSRDVAAYFQRLERRFTKDEIFNMPIEQLHEDFRSTEHYRSWQDTWYSEWFKNGTGVDVLPYAYPVFNPKRGVIHVGKDLPDRKRLDVVLLRFEDIDRWRSILWGSFFRHYHQDSVRLNDGEKKWYADVYKHFVETYKYSLYEMDAILSGDMMKFYSPEEIAQFMPSTGGKRTSSGQAVWNDYRERVKVGDRELVMHDLGEMGADADDLV